MVYNLRKELQRILENRDLADPDLRYRVRTALAEIAPSKMSYSAFLDWLDEDILAEWVNGEVVLASPASKIHQDIAGFLFSLLQQFSQHLDLGTVIQAPFQMRLANSGREPDLLFVSKKNLKRFEKTYLNGPADMVVEIISPESASRDRGEKFYEYETAGIPEYWLFDPKRKYAQIYHLQENNHYSDIFNGQSGRFDSKVVNGFWLNVDWLWQDPIPSPMAALAEIRGVAPGLLARFQAALGKMDNDK